VLGAAALAIVVALAAWFWLGRQEALSAGQPFTGGPRLALDTDTIDFGRVRFERMVTARFTVRNVGDKTLHLAANPPVEVVEGC
jgi:hypothetical protein